jgi:hypothetical protein
LDFLLLDAADLVLKLHVLNFLGLKTPLKFVFDAGHLKMEGLANF